MNDALPIWPAFDPWRTSIPNVTRQGSRLRPPAGEQSASVGDLEAGGRQWFATINVRSNKGPTGRAGRQILPLLTSSTRISRIRSSPRSSPGRRDFRRSIGPMHGGAIDYQRGNLFNPNAMRILPPEGAGDDGLVHRIGALPEPAPRRRDHDIFYGNAFANERSASDRRGVRLHARNAVRRRQYPWRRAIRAKSKFAARERRLARRRLFHLGRDRPAA